MLYQLRGSVAPNDENFRMCGHKATMVCLYLLYRYMEETRGNLQPQQVSWQRFQPILVLKADGEGWGKTTTN
jgi:hypothetical protein